MTMRLPWSFNWSPQNRSYSVRRRHRHNSVGENNNVTDLSSSYLSHSDDHYAKNIVYTTLLRSKAKFVAAKLRLKRSREEEYNDSSCIDIRTEVTKFSHHSLNRSQSVIGRRFRSLRRLKKLSMPSKDSRINDFSNTTSNETLNVSSLDMSLDETCSNYSPEPFVAVSILPSSPKRIKLTASSISSTPLSSKYATSTPCASTHITSTPSNISPILPHKSGLNTAPESPIGIRKHSYKVATSKNNSHNKSIPLKLLQNSPQLQRSHSKADCASEDLCDKSLKDEISYSPRDSNNSSKDTKHKKETFRSPVRHARHQATHTKDSRHLDAFEYYRAEDEREWARRFEEVHVDTKSASSMFKLLQSKLQYSAAYPHFLSLMHHLLLLPNDLGSPDSWILFDRVLQQLVTQAEDGQDREVKLLDINVNTIVKLIANERELTESRAKIMKLESEFADVVTDLNSKEQELYSHLQEKDEISRTLQQVRGQMEMEHNNSVDSQQRNVELEVRIQALTTQIQQLAAGSLSDDVKATLANTPVIQESITKCAPPPPPPPMMNGGPPPPPPPMMNGCGPPPPPPPGGKGPPPPPSGRVNKPTKQVPKSATTLRAFNWNKMPEARVNGTIFATLDESSLYKFMDLEDIDRTFDASARKQSTIEGERTIERLSRQRTQQITVIEGRRQQNCTILLSKLKMTNEELIRVLLKMDSDMEIAPDMVEQLLKFTPTAEEKSMLEEHVDELDSLARADRFLYDISKIDHYEERLQCLLYQKKFKERLAECEPRTLAVINASKELQNSKRLKKLMEVVLAFGNYMNKGARGGAYGFRISSLNKLTDTKSSNNRQITLLHYIIGVCEKQWKEVLKMEDDFPHLKEASKVNITELEKEISQLRQGLDFIEKEVNWHRGQGTTPPGDRFRLVMNEFTALAKDKFTHNECHFKNMKALFEKVVLLYGEDPKSAQPEDFFGTFDSFCDSFKDAKKDLDNMRKKEEEEERKRKEAERREAERERRARERKASMANMNGQASGDSSSGGENENDFDDLICALRSGDVFGKDIDKMRRKKKHSFSGASKERERIVGSHKYA